MDKVILTKEQQNSLMILLGDLESRSLALEQHVLKVCSGHGWSTNVFKPLNKLSVEDFSRALYNGYEVKETKDELLDYIEYIRLNSYNETLAEVKIRSVVTTLNILGIKIKGINE